MVTGRMHKGFSLISVFKSVNVCLILLQPISLVISEDVPLLILKVLFAVYQSSTVSLCLSLLAKHVRHFSGFSPRIILVMFWLAEAAWTIGSPKPSTVRRNHPDLIAPPFLFSWTTPFVIWKVVSQCYWDTFCPFSLWVEIVGQECFKGKLVAIPVLLGGCFCQQ